MCSEFADNLAILNANNSNNAVSRNRFCPQNQKDSSTDEHQKSHCIRQSYTVSSEKLILSHCSPTTREQSNISSLHINAKSHCNQHPTILKRTQKGKILGQFSPTPVKTLTFSPSRFLNIHKFNEINTSDSCKEDSFSSAEDSGIGLSDYDTTAPYPSFTSTPRAQSNQNVVQKSLNTSPSNECPATTCEEHDTNTPVIHKFLEESVLQTPTPFKCPEEGINKAENLVLSGLKCEDKLLLVGGPMVPCFRTRKSTPKMQKKARKVLVLDGTCDLKNKTLHRPSVLKAGSAQSDFLKPIRPQVRCSRKLPFADLYDHSSLTERTAVVKKRRVTPVKSIYFTRRRKHEEPILSRQWVDIACGSSSDQKDMIAAAKRCLYRL